MKSVKEIKSYRLVRITIEKPINGGVVKKEIQFTGYHGIVIVLITALVAGTVLILSGANII